jgi:predicted TIM-barrel fold metal-dependent hydrolase
MEIVNYMKTNGREKVMFGSNYPMITPAECLTDLETLGLKSDAAEDFLVNNAKQGFKL